jgi:heme-degrading monooxygenase HmoA
MYGTVARMRAKPGALEQLKKWADDYESPQGFVSMHFYQMDADPDEFYVTVLFESKEAYVATASSPEQDKAYRKMLQWLEAAPEWHDGEVVKAV